MDIPPMLMRSKLFVPGSRPELFAQAARSEADAISFELEDAVAPDRKPETSQIGIANQVFVAGDKEVECAHRVLEAAREAAEKGIQAFVVDGQLIDAPMISHARAVVAAAAHSRNTNQ